MFFVCPFKLVSYDPQLPEIATLDLTATKLIDRSHTFLNSFIINIISTVQGS